MKKANLEINYLSDQINELILKCEHKLLAAWALDCAERVLPYFENNYLQDDLPRLAIEAGRAWIRGELPMWEARKSAFPAHAAAREVASDLAACAAARSTGQALGAAHVPAHAPHAATYAAKAVGYAGGDALEERDWQYKHLLDLYSRRV